MSNRKVYADIKLIEPGMVLAEDVYNLEGVLLIPQGFKLNEASLNKIPDLGIQRIWVYDDNVVGITESQFENMKKLKDVQTPLKKEVSNSCKLSYASTKDFVKDALVGFTEGKSLNVEKVSETSQNLLYEFNNNLDIIRVLNTFRGYDDYTYTHSINVALLSSMMAKWLYLSVEEIKDLTTAGMLHDIGKAKLPHELLNKPATLTDEEYEKIKQHSMLGYRAVETLGNMNQNIKMGILMHHERIDGSGYPLKAKSDQIPLFARIIAICDVFDAMTSETVYRRKTFPFKVFKELEQEAMGKLDIELVYLFLKNMANFYVGEVVELSTGEYGEIVFINPTCIYKPIVKVDNTFIDLMLESGTSMVGFI